MGKKKTRIGGTIKKSKKARKGSLAAKKS